MYISRIIPQINPTVYNHFQNKIEKNSKTLDFSSKIDEKNNYVINIPIPGVPTESVKVFRNDKSLSVQVNDQSKTMSQIMFDVSKKYDISKLSVKHKLGMLTITIPMNHDNKSDFINVPIEM
jgi:HSP20 family molecular chaperone IbpA